MTIAQSSDGRKVGVRRRWRLAGAHVAKSQHLFIGGLTEQRKARPKRNKIFVQGLYRAVVLEQRSRSAAGPGSAVDIPVDGGGGRIHLHGVDEAPVHYVVQVPVVMDDLRIA